MPTVVVIDGDTDVRHVICALLRSGGYVALPFPDAQPALEQLDSSRVDLVITELDMETSGEACVEQLRWPSTLMHVSS